MTKNKISINLLPAEYTGLLKEYTKFYKIQTISIILILVLIFLSSITVALRLFQSQRIKIAQANLEDVTTKVTQQKPKESSLTVLKSRLSTIDQISSLPSKQREMYNLVSSLLPPSLNISNVSVDKSGGMLLSIISQDFSNIDSFITQLTTDPSQNKINQVIIEGLSRSRDGTYRGNLKIIAK